MNFVTSEASSRVTRHGPTEFDALQRYPAPSSPRIVSGRRIANRIIASERGEAFFDGDRANGYGGLKDDGRWKRTAEFMVEHYQLQPRAKIFQIQCEKGFLLREFEALGMQSSGTDSSFYAVQKAAYDICWRPVVSPHHVWDHSYDLVIAIGAVYTLNLTDAIACLREIQRLTSRHAFITLAAYESEDDHRLLRAWSLLGTTILTKADWIEVMQHAGYTGDYAFVTAQSLGLSWA